MSNNELLSKSSIISDEEGDLASEISLEERILREYVEPGPEQRKIDLLSNIIVIEPVDVAGSTYLAH
jgi:hypothetical protein